VLLVIAVKVRNVSEGLCIAPTVDVGEVAYHTDLLGVPVVRNMVVPVVTIKMLVPEKQPVDFAIVQIFFAAVHNDRKILFMDYFVALQVEQPIARACSFCDIRLMGVLCSLRIFFEVPYGVDKSYFGRAYTFDLFTRAIVRVAVANGDYKLIDNGENRFD